VFAEQHPGGATVKTAASVDFDDLKIDLFERRNRRDDERLRRSRKSIETSSPPPSTGFSVSSTTVAPNLNVSDTGDVLVVLKSALFEMNSAVPRSKIDHRTTIRPIRGLRRITTD